jgi:hypothetical protein
VKEIAQQHLATISSQYSFDECDCLLTPLSLQQLTSLDLSPSLDDTAIRYCHLPSLTQLTLRSSAFAKGQFCFLASSPFQRIERLTLWHCDEKADTPPTADVYKDTFASMSFLPTLVLHRIASASFNRLLAQLHHTPALRLLQIEAGTLKYGTKQNTRVVSALDELQSLLAATNQLHVQLLLNAAKARESREELQEVSANKEQTWPSYLLFSLSLSLPHVLSGGGALRNRR